MKNFVKTIAVAVLMLCAAAASAQNYGRYEVRRDRVYFNGVELRQAEARWFNDLGYGYAKDRNHVYLNGQILPYVDPSSFKVDRRYAPASGSLTGGNLGFGSDYVNGWYDKGYVVAGIYVLFNGRVIDGAAVSSFKDLGSGYAKDAHHVYFCGERMQGTMVQNFKVIKDGYARNNYDVYYLGKKIHGASASSFRLIADGYARDAHSVYYCGEKLHQANVNSFRVLRGGYANDAFHAYYLGKIVK